MRALFIASLALLCLGLVACGDDAADHTDDDRASDSGARTPEALLDRIEGMAGDDMGLPDLLDVIHPDEQPAMAFMLGLAPIFIESMSAAFQEGAEADATTKKVEALFAKYGLDEEKLQAEMGQMQGAENATPQEQLELMGKPLQGVDHKAFVRDAWAILEDSENTSTFDMEAFAKARESLVVDGDRATIDGPESIGKMVLVKADDGFWYISAAESGMLGN